MIDHGTARRLAATDLDFPLDAPERATLDLHVTSCVACQTQVAGLRRDAVMLRELDLGPVPIAVRAHVAIAAERPGSGLNSWWVTLVAAALLLIATIGGVGFVGTGAGEGDRQPARVGRSVHWTTQVVDLVAQDLWIEAAERRFVPPPDRQLKIISDPGNKTRWTLEVVWLDGDVEMHLNLFFASDGERWRITEIRTYDGRNPGEWLDSRAPVVEAPLGAPFVGDVAIELEDHSGPNQGPGRLVIRGLRLSTIPGAGGGGPGAVDPNKPIVIPVPKFPLGSSSL
jgi:hypothetical protein